MIITLDAILSDNAIKTALLHLKKKKGVPGVDHMSVDELLKYWEENSSTIKDKLNNGIYRPKPLLVRYIPKNGTSEKRKLEIPCMIDRMILYAMQLTLAPLFDKKFSENSFGFRKGRNCMDALNACLKKINSGTNYIVDLDIKNFFDSVAHDILLKQLKEYISDKEMLKILENYIKIKVIDKNKCFQKKVGISQGSALSPLLANIYLNEMDKFFEYLQIPFVRYADDIVIFAKTLSEAREVFNSTRSFAENRLMLKLNKQKTSIIRPHYLTYLGYGFMRGKNKQYTLTVSNKAKEKMLLHIKEIIINSNISIEECLETLGAFNRGWINYYQKMDLSHTDSFFEVVEQYEKECMKQRIFRDKAKSKTFIMALYNCESYSSMRGWFQKEQRKNKQHPTGGEIMASNYNQWRSRELYKTNPIVKSNYSKIIRKPFFYSENCQLHRSHFYFPESVTPDKKNKNIYCAILGILAAGKCMIFAQLYLYLLLQGYSVTKKQLKNIIYYLGYVGIVSKDIIYPHRMCVQKRRIIHGYHVSHYQLTSKGVNYVKQISAPSDWLKWIDPMKDSSAKIIHRVVNSILWNQIILNYLIFEPRFSYYNIFKMISEGDTAIEISLCIQTNQKIYFEYIHKVNKDLVEKAMNKLEMYYQKYPYDMQYVIVSNDYPQLQQIKYCIEKQLILKPWICSYNIMFSVVHSWFGNYAGILIPYSEIK